MVSERSEPDGSSLCSGLSSTGRCAQSGVNFARERTFFRDISNVAREPAEEKAAMRAPMLLDFFVPKYANWKIEWSLALARLPMARRDTPVPSSPLLAVTHRKWKSHTRVQSLARG